MYRISRREFLAQLGLAAAGGVLVSCAPAGPAAPGGVMLLPAAEVAIVPGAGEGEDCPRCTRAQRP